MPEAVILSTVRTPIGAHGGALAAVRPDDMAALVIQSAVERAALDPQLIEEVYLGCANQAGEDNRNIARMSALLAGLPVSTAGVTFNRLCASGLTAINAAYRAIKVGEGDFFVAGGVESMSRSPYAFSKAERSFPWGHGTLWDTTLGWRFPNPEMENSYGTDPLGITAENIYDQTKISREAQDAFAFESHRRAIHAIDNGLFEQEIVPVHIPRRKADPLIFDTDERPRRDTSMEALSNLKPAFREGGTVTAGNSSGINDGAAALVVANEERALELDLVPLARIKATAAAGVEPRTMGLGPIPATRKALARAGLSIDSIGLIELNEAFAVQALAVMRELDLPHDRTNVNGGAIALGHPLGCSGARLMTTLLHEMGRRAGDTPHQFYGLASLCVGVGQGETTIVEWI
jgi:3-oxoadipyl-CoA thiolase